MPKHPIIKKNFYLLWHKFSSRRFSIRTVIFEGAVLSTWFLAFIYPPLRAGKIGLALGMAATAAYVIYGFLKAFSAQRSPVRRHLELGKTRRKLMTTAILDKLLNNALKNTRTTDNGMEALRDVLDVVADHVRTFRLDSSGQMIFCSLLIEHDTDNLKVIARNRGGRNTSPTYRKIGMQAWASMASIEVLESGDIFVDRPQTPGGKPYRSVLTIPIVFEQNCIAVLSIDSSEPYHFTDQAQRLETFLLPYIVLLKTILLEYTVINVHRRGE